MAKLNDPDLEKANGFTDMMLDYARDHEIDAATAMLAAEVYIGQIISQLGRPVLNKNVKASAASIRKAAEGIAALSEHQDQSNAMH